jgi:hypothetical protein
MGIYNNAMKTQSDTFILLWGGAVSPASAKRVMYWATNDEGTLCGIVLPETVWSGIEKTISSPAGLDSPYVTVGATGLSTLTPELRLLTVDAETLYDFCYLKNAVYRLRQTPKKLKIEPDKVMGHIGLADAPPLASLRRFGTVPEKGEFFTFMPDKARVELYYLIEEGETPPETLGIQVLWGLRGYGLPAVVQGTGYQPAEAEKAMLGRSAVKPKPFWLRQVGRLFKRRRVY